MKNSTYFIFFLFTLFLLSESCEQSNHMPTLCEEDCYLESIDTSFLVTAKCYNCAAKNYQRSETPFKVNGTRIDGFRVDPVELIQMLEAILSPIDTLFPDSKKHKIDSILRTRELYAMLTIRDSLVIIKNSKKIEPLTKPVAHLIFVTQKDTTGNKLKSEFFDFTAPCPDFCPVIE